MRRFVGPTVSLLGMLTFFVLASQIIFDVQILPQQAEIGGFALIVAILFSLAGFLSGFKDTIELFKIFNESRQHLLVKTNVRISDKVVFSILLINKGDKKVHLDQFGLMMQTIPTDYLGGSFIDKLFFFEEIPSIPEPVALPISLASGEFKRIEFHMKLTLAEGEGESGILKIIAPEVPQILKKQEKSVKRIKYFFLHNIEGYEYRIPIDRLNGNLLVDRKPDSIDRFLASIARVKSEIEFRN